MLSNDVQQARYILRPIFLLQYLPLDNEHLKHRFLAIYKTEETGFWVVIHSEGEENN